MRRLAEIQFFFFCRKIIYHTDKSIKVISDMIDLFSFTNYYDSAILKDTVKAMFVKQKGTPTLLECVVLRYKDKSLRYEDIRQQFQVDQRAIEREFDKACELGLMYKTPNPKFSIDVYNSIIGFKKAINKILKWNGFIEHEQRNKDKTD